MKKECISRVLTTKGVKNFLPSAKLGKGAGYKKYRILTFIVMVFFSP